METKPSNPLHPSWEKGKLPSPAGKRLLGGVHPVEDETHSPTLESQKGRYVADMALREAEGGSAKGSPGPSDERIFLNEKKKDCLKNLDGLKVAIVDLKKTDLTMLARAFLNDVDFFAACTEAIIQIAQTQAFLDHATTVAELKEQLQTMFKGIKIEKLTKELERALRSETFKKISPFLENVGKILQELEQH